MHLLLLFHEDGINEKFGFAEKLRSWLLLLKETVEKLDINSLDASSLISELKSRLDQVLCAKNFFKSWWKT